MHIDLTVIIPTFNEEENIERMIVTVDTICKAHNITEEILVVDDRFCRWNDNFGQGFTIHI